MNVCSITVMAFLTLSASAAAADYPDRPIRLVVPFLAGGSSDAAARTLAQALHKAMGQQIIVENRPGANGAIAAQGVLGAAPDGYTLLWAAASMVAIPLLQKAPPFESFSAFTPISSVGQFVFCMYVHPSVPAQSVAQFVAYARANPDKLNYASATLSEHMAASQLIKAAGINMVRVPYKGGVQAMPDLVSGRAQVKFGPLSSGLREVKEGKLQMPACLASQRIPAAPNVPTMAEAGFGTVTVPTWQAVFGPAGTPLAVVQRLSAEIARALQDPEARRQFALQHLETQASTPEVLAAVVRADHGLWLRFMRENGIAPE